MTNSRPKKQPTLCFSCKRLDCTWMKNLEPVAGWDAKKTVIRNRASGKDVLVPSYCVESCPGYVPSEYRRKENVTP